MPIEPDANGDLHIAPLGLALGLRSGSYLGLDGPFLRWIDGEAVVPTDAEPALLAQADAQKARADADVARAEAEALRPA